MNGRGLSTSLRAERRAPRPSMGAPLDFSATLKLMWQMDKQARKNFMAIHKRMFIALALGLTLIFGVLGLLAYQEEQDRKDYPPYYHEPEPKDHGKELDEDLKDSELAYFAMIGITVLVLPVWWFIHSARTNVMAVVQRRTGKTDFLYPAPLPSHAHFWYGLRQQLMVTLFLPTLLLTLYINLIIDGHLPFWLWLKLVFVSTCAIGCMVAISNFFWFTLPDYPPPWPEQLPRAVKTICFGVFALVLLWSVLEQEFGWQSWEDSMYDLLVHPLTQVLLAYPIAMSDILAASSLTGQVLAEIVLLAQIPGLMIFYLRMKPHHLHEMPLVPGIWGLASGWGAWAGSPLEHREVGSQKLPFWQRIRLPFPQRGEGLTGYALMRLSMALRGPTLVTMASGWLLALGLIVMFQSVEGAPVDYDHSQDRLFLIVMTSLYILLFLMLAGARNIISPQQVGTERTLPLNRPARYFLQMGIALVSPVIFLAGMLPLMHLAAAPYPDAVWDLAGNDTLVMVMSMSMLWLGLGPIAFFWTFAPDYRPGSPQTLVAIGLFVVLALFLVHIFIAVVFDFAATTVISIILLVILVALGYERFLKADVRV